MRVTTKELRKATETLLKHLDETGQSEFEFEQDYYWWIPRESLYTPYAQPTELTLGQLTDDWSEIQAIAAGENDALAYGLVWLSTVLRAVGERAIG